MRKLDHPRERSVSGVQWDKGRGHEDLEHDVQRESSRRRDAKGARNKRPSNIPSQWDSQPPQRGRPKDSGTNRQPPQHPAGNLTKPTHGARCAGHPKSRSHCASDPKPPHDVVRFPRNGPTTMRGAAYSGHKKPAPCPYNARPHSAT